MPDNPQKSGDGQDGNENKPKKRKRGRPRKSDQSTLNKIPSTPTKKLNPYEKKKLAVLDEKTRTAQVLRYLIAGYSKEEISDELEISVKTVSNLALQAYDKINDEISMMRDNWAQISLTRTEIMMKKLMDKVTKEKYDIEKGDVDMMSKIMDLQIRIMGGDGKVGVAIQNNYYTPQMDSNSAAYRYALAQEQQKITGKTMDGLEDLVVEEDGMIAKLDGLLEK
jgi:hypothetical protein